MTVLQEGGHVAEILDKSTGINPLWTPPWPSIEPSTYDAAKHPEYGQGIECRLLAGIMGHNLCLDVFGGPSSEEAEAGIGVHGESSVAPYRIEEIGGELVLSAELDLAQLHIERRIALSGRRVRIRETVTNRSATDRPIAWTQHVSLGPPFLEKGVTHFRTPATRSKVFEHSFGSDDYLACGAEFDWPMAPRTDGGLADLQILNLTAQSSAYTAHLMDPDREHSFFIAYTPSLKLAFGYVWKTADFPWMGIWEENHSRAHAPWNGATLARGMEFGVSPIPETRRAMIDRGKLFGVPGYRWLPARRRLDVEYCASAWPSDSLPESLEWPSGF